VLSRFAGAAHQLGDALIVNPYDTQEVAEAIRTALAMPRSERIRRFERLYAVISSTDIGWWTSRYLAALSGLDIPSGDTVPPGTPKLPRSSRKAAAKVDGTAPGPSLEPARKPSSQGDGEPSRPPRAGKARGRSREFRPASAAKALPNSPSPR
jgi:trehalose 6-phosphate synthase